MLLAVAAGGTVVSAATAQESPQVRLLVPAVDAPAPAPEGHVLVTWEIPGAPPDDLSTFEIEYGENRDFRDAVRRNVGVDRASFLSGLPDGPTYVRVRALADGAPPGPWSEPGVIAVQYPGANVVRNLMLLGAATLLVLLTVIARGHLWALRQEPSAESADVG